MTVDTIVLVYLREVGVGESDFSLVGMLDLVGKVNHFAY